VIRGEGEKFLAVTLRKAELKIKANLNMKRIHYRRMLYKIVKPIVRYIHEA